MKRLRLLLALASELIELSLPLFSILFAVCSLGSMASGRALEAIWFLLVILAVKR